MWTARAPIPAWDLTLVMHASRMPVIQYNTQRVGSQLEK